MDRLFFLFPRSLINIPSGVYYKAQWLLFLQILCAHEVNFCYRLHDNCVKQNKKVKACI